MGQPIQPGDLQFITREYYLNGGTDTAKGSTLTFEELDTTLIYLSNSIANVNPTINTSSLLLTASANLNVITFTKGDGTTQFAIMIDTGSGQTYTAGNGINIDGSNVVSAKLGAGLEFNSSDIQATVRTVNLQGPTNGNIPLSITNTITGPSSSLSGSPFFLPDTYSPRPPVSGTIFVVSGDGDPNKNGNAYIFVTSSTQAGSWQQIFGFNESTADARYVKLSSSTTQNITSSLLISGSTTFSGSLFWSGSPNANGATANVIVLSNGQLYVTGAYGSGGGGTAGSPDRSFQYNDAGDFSGAANFTITDPDIFNITGSLIVSNSLSIVGTESITGSLNISSSTIGQKLLQITGTGSSTTPPMVQISGQSGGSIQIYDSNSGSLFSVNNNTGTAIVDVRSNGQTLIGSNTFQGTYDSVGIASFSGPTQSLLIPGYLTSSFNMLLMDFTAISGSYGKVGTFTAIMSGSTIDGAASTNRSFGIGPLGVNNINFDISMSGQYYTIIARSDTNGWFVKGIVRGI